MKVFDTLLSLSNERYINKDAFLKNVLLGLTDFIFKIHKILFIYYMILFPFF